MKKKVVVATISTIALSGASMADQVPGTLHEERASTERLLTQATSVEFDLEELASKADPGYVLAHVDKFANLSKYR